jgi:predicted nucleotidyltransferase
VKKEKTMVFPKDYLDILEIFLAENVQFMIIGGYAVGLWGHPRATKDLDLWIWANPENAIKVVRALKIFGAPMDDISEKDFEKEGVIFQMGVDPVRIDVTTTIEGIHFEEAYPNKQDIDINGMKVPLISVDDLIKNKKASGRLQDLADNERLEIIRKRQKEK